MKRFVLFGVAAATVLGVTGVLYVYNTKRRHITNGLAQQQTVKFKRIRILFGSQTGTAEGFARQLGDRLRAVSSSWQLEAVSVDDLFHVDPASSLLSAPSDVLLIFIIATHGEGDPPDSARPLFRWIASKRRDTQCLDSLRYAVMGLGNSQYTQFNAAGRRLDAHLRRLGGVNMCHRGEGDDDKDIEYDFETWVETQLLPIVATSSHAPQQQQLFNAICESWKDLDAAKHMQCCSVRSSSSSSFETGGPNRTGASGAKWLMDSVLVPITGTRELRQTPEHGKTTKEICVDLSKASRIVDRQQLSRHRHPSSVESTTTHVPLEAQTQCVHALGWWARPTYASYATGATAEVLVPNTSDDVARCFAIFTSQGAVVKRTDVVVTTEENNGSSSCCSSRFLGSTIEQCLTHLCHLTGPVSKDVLRKFGAFLPDDAKQRLQALLCNQTDFQRFVHDQRLSLCDCFELFFSRANFSCSPWSFLTALELLPPPQPRSYSICSSSLQEPRCLAIAVSQHIETKTPTYLLPLSVLREQLIQCGYLDSNEMRCDVAVGLPRPPPIKETTTTTTAPRTRRRYRGFCSSQLCRMTLDATPQPSSPEFCHLLLRVVPSTLRFPSETKDAMILIATGTGIGPIRGYLRDLDYRTTKRQQTTPPPLASSSREMWRLPAAVVLCFGCCHPEKDFLYKAELEDWTHARPHRPPLITHFWPAFSREQHSSSGKKLYVQDRLHEHAQEVRTLVLEARARIYVCGSLLMGQAVRAALTDILSADGMNTLVSSGRFCLETW